MINSKCLFVVLCYGIISCFYSCIQKPIKEVWLDDFGSDSCYIQDWGRVQVNTSVLNTPLTVNGVVYDRGLGVHSISRLFYQLDGEAISISGLAGADDNNLFSGKFQFKLIGDKKELWKSGVIKKGALLRNLMFR